MLAPEVVADLRKLMEKLQLDPAIVLQQFQVPRLEDLSSEGEQALYQILLSRLDYVRQRESA